MSEIEYDVPTTPPGRTVRLRTIVVSGVAAVTVGVLGGAGIAAAAGGTAQQGRFGPGGLPGRGQVQGFGPGVGPGAGFAPPGTGGLPQQRAQG